MLDDTCHHAPSKAPEPVIPKCWAVEKQKKAGHVAYRLYRKVEPSRPAASE